MVSFRLASNVKTQRLHIFGRMIARNQILTMSDKDAKKYLDYKLQGVTQFEECEPVNEDEQVTTGNGTSPVTTSAAKQGEDLNTPDDVEKI